jgi:hypothetical protein
MEKKCTMEKKKKKKEKKKGGELTKCTTQASKLW